MLLRLTLGCAVCATLWMAGAVFADDEPGDVPGGEPSASSPADPQGADPASPDENDPQSRTESTSEEPTEGEGQPTGGKVVSTSSNLDSEVSEIADAIREVLKKYELDSIAVGQFTGPAQAASSSGPAIAHSLIQQLEGRGVRIPKFRAEFQVKGDYQDVIDKRSGSPAVKITARVLDRDGNLIEEFERGVFGAETVAQVMGVTVEIEPDQPVEEQNEALLLALDKPAVHLTSSRVMAGEESHFGMEVLVKSNGKYEPRTPTEDEGFSFVEIKRSESYAVRLINDSPHDVAIKLSIDGLNMFTFSESEGYKKLGIVIVPAGKSGIIKGWHRTNTDSDEFQVTEYAKSAAGESGALESESKLGVITATFHAAWPKGSEPPSDEPRLAARAADATGRGPSVGAKYNEVERTIGQFRAAVSVRYSK